MKKFTFLFFLTHITLFIWTSGNAQYCTTSGNSEYEQITNVTFAGINNTTTTHAGYNDFTALEASVSREENPELSVTIMPYIDGNEYVYAFIDWNNNGVLNDAGEVYTLAVSTSSNGPHTMNVTVPNDAELGNIRMRVILAYNMAYPNPCGNFDFGEVEDYTVNVMPAALQCPTGDITFNTQVAIDAFGVTYGHCTEIPGNVLIVGNYITNLDGLSSLASIGESLDIKNTSQLSSLNGLSSLTSIGGNIDIFNNSQLANIDGLSSLTSIGGSLYIEANANLTDISGIANIDPATILGSDGLYIINNTKLEVCNLPNFCTYLAGSGPRTISGNLGTCYDVDAVVTACTPLAECPTGDITFTTQAQIDAFGVTYRHCTELPGHLTIILGNDITNLNGLSSLTGVGGSLSIAYNFQLTDISGLSSLTSVGSNFMFRYNEQIENLDALSSLTSIGGSLSIRDNIALTNISGLANIDPATIGGSEGLYIVDNTNLEVCNMPNFCTYLAGSGPRTISGNLGTCYDVDAVVAACNPLAACPTGSFNFYSQADIDNFGVTYSHCNNISLDFILISGSDIVNLDGLANVTSINTNLNIYNNPQLNNLDGLSNITSINGSIFINFNPQLSDISGLQNIDPATIQGSYGLNIINNTSLSVCNLPNFCTYLSDLNNPRAISNNLEQCLNEAAVMAVCTPLAACPTEDFFFTTQAQIDDFGVTYGHCTEIPGNVIISGDDITNLDGLTSVISIGGDLDIEDNSQLTDLDGLSSLTNIGGYLSIYYNEELANVNGLSSLIDIGDALGIEGNSLLADLDGMSSLTSIGGDLDIYYHDELTNVNGLSSLTSIGETFYIVGNSQLQNLDGLSSLTNIGGELYIQSNSALTDISGIGNIDPTTIGGYYGLYIRNNANLEVCNLPNLCTYLSGSGPRTISANKSTCLDLDAVLAACTEGELIPDGDNILYVNKNVSGGDGSGDSWTNATPELADALLWAKGNEDISWETTPLQIYVAQGIYKPLYSPEDGANFGTDQDRNNSFSMVNNVQIYGGFVPDNGVTTLAHSRILPQLGNSGSILSGDIGIGNDASDNAYNVVISAGEMGTAILDGFTITDGNANTYSDILINTKQVYKCSGSGIYNSESSPTYKNLVLYNNSCTESGGGMFSYMSSPKLEQIVFKNNQAKDGGGMANQHDSSPTLLNVSIESNMASENGSAMYNIDLSSPVLINVTIAGNEGTVNGEEIEGCVSANSVTFINSIVWDVVSGNYTAQNSLIQGNNDGSNGNLVAIGHVDTDIFNDPANGDFSLVANSLGINVGNNVAYTTAGGDLVNDEDIAGNPRIYDYVNSGIIDMGAYEFQGEPDLSRTYFVTTWETTLPYEKITIPTNGSGYSYDVNWGDGSTDLAVSGNRMHRYNHPGVYTVKISGDFPSIYFNNNGDRLKLKSIVQWGTNVWSSMNSAFSGCENLIVNATDVPNLSQVTDMSSMFFLAIRFNQDISNWNVSNVTDMNKMFGYASTFNQDLNNWNVSNVTNMSYMFAMAESFNKNIDSWNVGVVTNMSNMFYSATNFDQNIGNWDVSNVTDMTMMFNNVTLSTTNYDSLLNGWNSLTLQNGVNFNGGNSTYCDGESARNNIINSFGWTIDDGGLNCSGFCADQTEYTTAEGWSNGIPDTNKKAVFADDYNTTLGSIEACAIEINEGVTLTVSEGTTIRTENDITINGDLIFLSSATGNGELASMGSNSVITGNATVQCYMQNKRSYRMVSSAVTTGTSIHNNWQEGATSNTNNPTSGFGTHITGTTTDQTNGFDGTITGNPSMFTVNVGAQQFEAIANTDVNTLNAGNAYLLFVRGDRSIDLGNDLAAGETVLRATGALATGTNIQDFATETTGDFVMFGNPYQSVVDLNSVLATSTNLNTNFYYMYDPSLGDFGAYVTVSLPSGSNTASSTANQYLQPGQGGQAATFTDGVSAAVFNESDKAPGNFNSTNRPLVANDMLTVQLYTTENYNNNGAVHDSFGIVFSDGNNNEVTAADAKKPINFYENLGINNNGTYLSIEQREMPQSDEVYSLYSTGYQHADYTLKIVVDGLEGNFFCLDDSFTGTNTLLEAGENIYSFSVDSENAFSITTNRFSIRTVQRLEINDNNIFGGGRLYPNPLNGDTFYINAPKLNGEQLSVSISDLTGRSIYEQTLDCRANTVTVPMGNNVASGVYLVTLKNGGDSQTYRLIKE